MTGPLPRTNKHAASHYPLCSSALSVSYRYYNFVVFLTHFSKSWLLIGRLNNGTPTALVMWWTSRELFLLRFTAPRGASPTPLPTPPHLIPNFPRTLVTLVFSRVIPTALVLSCNAAMPLTAASAPFSRPWLLPSTLPSLCPCWWGIQCLRLHSPCLPSTRARYPVTLCCSPSSSSTLVLSGVT